MHPTAARAAAWASMDAAPTRRRLRALQRHTSTAAAGGVGSGYAFPGGVTPNSGATNRALRVPRMLSRCSGPQDLTPSAYKKTLEPDDCAFFASAPARYLSVHISVCRFHSDGGLRCVGVCRKSMDF